MKPSEFQNNITDRNRYNPYTNQGEKLYQEVLKIQKLEKEAVDKYKEKLKDKINKEIFGLEMMSDRSDYRPLDHKLRKERILQLKEILELLK